MFFVLSAFVNLRHLFVFSLSEVCELTSSETVCMFRLSGVCELPSSVCVFRLKTCTDFKEKNKGTNRGQLSFTYLVHSNIHTVHVAIVLSV